MDVLRIDPVRDPRWTPFVDGHTRSSVFHSSAWLEALQRTYGFTPFALTTSRPDVPLENALVFCRVKSWITGERAVSLPFSDHCELLAERQAGLEELLQAATPMTDYIEIRPFGPLPPAADWRETASFCLHRIDLRDDLAAIHSRLHRSCAQRQIRRALRNGLTVEQGRSDSLIRRFYQLLVVTRRRHGFPPQPLRWFRNLAALMGDRMTIWLASTGDGVPAAGLLTLRHGSTMTYKYGGSDSRLNRFGAMPLLLWRAIQQAKEAELDWFDLGRSDWDNPGLLAFKDHWGGERTTLRYFRIGPKAGGSSGGIAPGRLSRWVFANMPAALLPAIGRTLYPHLH